MQEDINTKEHMRRALQELVRVSGGTRRLALALGVSHPTVKTWVKKGRISKYGAALVNISAFLSVAFDQEYVRPDMDDKDLSRVLDSELYEKAQDRMVEFELSSESEDFPPAIFVHRLEVSDSLKRMD